MAQSFDGDGPDDDGREPYRVRLPGFITGEEEVGLGDVIKRATSYLGIQPCGGCERRADALNRRLMFTTQAQRRSGHD
jgi:hypothetical protein